MATTTNVSVDDPKAVPREEWNGEFGAGECLRFGGLMMADQCFDFWSDSGNLDFLAWRCVQCGEIVDPIILRNRHLQLSGILPKMREVQVPRRQVRLLTLHSSTQSD